MPIDEVFKLPSQAILEGIWQGRIRNPEAMRGYFLSRRNEFLRAHPHRADELDGPGEIGRWERLVYSNTAAEGNAFAAFCDSEIHRRSAGLTDAQLDSPAQLQGVANLRQMAGSWHQRATRLVDTEPDLHGQTNPSDTTSVSPQWTPEATPDMPELTPASQNVRQQPDYVRMMDYEVLDGINNGSLTSTEAVHVFVSKSLDSVRGLYDGEELQEKETEYAEVIYGEPQDMIRFCLTQASGHTAYGAPGAPVSPANYKIASRWYGMAGRFAQEAAQSRRDEDTEDTEAGEEP